MKRTAVLLAFLGLASTASARDRPLELFLGDMSPAGSRACARDLGRELRSRDHDAVNVTRVGEPSVRRMVGDEEGDFMAWDEDDLRPIVERRRETPYDAVALLDCRDTEARLLVHAPSGAIARFTLRETTIDEERARWLGRTLLTQAWIGFDP